MLEHAAGRAIEFAGIRCVVQFIRLEKRHFAQFGTSSVRVACLPFAFYRNGPDSVCANRKFSMAPGHAKEEDSDCQMYGCNLAGSCALSATPARAGLGIDLLRDERGSGAETAPVPPTSPVGSACRTFVPLKLRRKHLASNGRNRLNSPAARAGLARHRASSRGFSVIAASCRNLAPYVG